MVAKSRFPWIAIVLVVVGLASLGYAFASRPERMSLVLPDIVKQLAEESHKQDDGLDWRGGGLVEDIQSRASFTGDPEPLKARLVERIRYLRDLITKAQLTIVEESDLAAFAGGSTAAYTCRFESPSTRGMLTVTFLSRKNDAPTTIEFTATGDVFMPRITPPPDERAR